MCHLLEPNPPKVLADVAVGAPNDGVLNENDGAAAVGAAPKPPNDAPNPPNPAGAEQN